MVLSDFFDSDEHSNLTIECFTELWKHSEDLMFIMAVEDDGEFTLYENNPASRQIMGLAQDEKVHRMNLRETWGDEVVEDLYQTYQKVIEGRKPYSEEQYVIKDGVATYVDTLFVPIFDNAGNPVFICGVSRDITKVREAEKIALEAKAKAEEYNEALKTVNRALDEKVQERTIELAKATSVAEQATYAKSEFLAKMSHEIRTPLNAIIGLSRLTIRSGLNHYQQENLNKILDSSEVLLGVINDILDFSKIEAGKLDIEETGFSLHKLIHKCTSIVNFKAFEKGLEVVTYIAPEIPDNLIGDPLRIQQVINNLLTNAIKFTSSGTVTLTVNSLKEDAGIRKLQFCVTDTGIGINEEEQAKLFRSFSQGDDSVTRKYGGTGLGLVICKQLCELMQGDISVNSEEGKGSCFTFTILVKDDLTASQRIEPIGKDALAKLKILVADDVELCRKAIMDVLVQANISAKAVDNGVAAVEEVKSANAKGTPYDLVIMDWKMPQLNGVEAAKEIQALSGDNSPRIMMVSSYDKDEVKRLSKPFGVTQFLEKPINQSSLIDSLFAIVSSVQVYEPEPVQEGTVPDLNNRRILLVEDNVLNQRVAKGFLSDTLAQVDVADNGLIALDMLAKDNNYELVLMDIQMPVMDGLTAAKKARQELEIDIPIIAMTAHAMAGDSEKSLDAGMNAHITKPIDPNELYRTLVEHLHVLEPSPLKSVTEEEPPQETSLFIQECGKLYWLNTKAALISLQGKTGMYEQLLKDFAHQRKTLVSLEQALENEKLNEIFSIAHTLKSTSHYIGAFEISELAEKLETLCKEHKSCELIKNTGAELCTLFSDLLGALEAIEQKYVEPEVIPEFSIEKINDIALSLKQALEVSSIESEEIANKLNKIASGTEYQSKTQAIFDLCDDLEFEDAAEKLDILIEQFKLSI